MNTYTQDQSNSEASTKSKTLKKGLSVQEQLENQIKEDSNEKYENIIKKNFRISMILENKSIEIKDIQIEELDKLSYGINDLDK